MQPSRRGELVGIRPLDLDTGQRVRIPGTRRLAMVVSVERDEDWTDRIVVHTSDAPFTCSRGDLIDAEEISEVMF